MIYGERIRLRAPEREDLPRFVAWLNDPEVRENILLYLPMSLVAEERWFEEMLSRPDPEHPMVIEIREGEGWEPIGNCGMLNLDWRNRSAELGIFIGEKSLWNHGYGTEAMRLLLQHGFNTLNLNRMFLRVFETNLRGIRAYEKAGFVHEGRARQAQYQDGRYVDVLWMSVLRSEWRP
jgi:RimJ/RimL family protein N-acetyltransferase